MGRKKNNPDESKPDAEKAKQPRKRGAAIFTRLEQSLYDEFMAKLEKIEPRTSIQAVLEMLIKRWLREDEREGRG